MRESCPGSKEITNPFPEPIVCVFCSAKNEIWSDEADTTCTSCGKSINRDMKPSCIDYCPSARDCIGSFKYDRIMKAKNNVA